MYIAINVLMSVSEDWFLLAVKQVGTISNVKVYVKYCEMCRTTTWKCCVSIHSNYW